jgi:hypothetical protein
VFGFGGPPPLPPPPGPASATGDAALARAAERTLVDDESSQRSSWLRAAAEQRLDAACMRERGFRYPAGDPGPPPTKGLTTEDVIGSARPASYGVTSADGQDGQPAEDRYLDSLPADQRDRYRQAFQGRASEKATLRLPSGQEVTYATGGCLSQVRARLYGSAKAAIADTMAPQDVRRSFTDSLASDAAYQAALGRWRHCMAAAGWPSQDPADAVDSIQAMADQSADAGELTARQEWLAQADVGCDGPAGLRASRAAARARFVRTLPPPVLAALADVAAARERAERIAGTVTGTVTG